MSVGNAVLVVMALAALAGMAYVLWKTRTAKRAIDARMIQQRLDDEARRQRLLAQQIAERKLRSAPVEPYRVTAYSYDTTPKPAKLKPRPAAPKTTKRSTSSASGYADYTNSGASFIDYSDSGSSYSSPSDSGSSSSYSSYDSGSSSSSSDSGSSGGGSCD